MTQDQLLRRALLLKRLGEAEEAQHKLMTNQQEVQIRDSNGESVTFSTANASRLREYIKGLRLELAMLGRAANTGPLQPKWR